LETENFDYTVYRLPYTESEKPSFIDEIYSSIRRLSVNGVWDRYWVFFEEVPDSAKQICQSSDNINLTIDALRFALNNRCKKNIDESKLFINKKFRRYVEIITDEYDEGNGVVQLEPYYLRSLRQFGFLVNQRFRAKEQYRGTSQVLKRQLILNQQGRVNPDYYINRHEQLIDFVKKFHVKIFPLTLSGNSIVKVSNHLIQLDAESLKTKKYVVGSGDESPSQFMGIQKYGPVGGVPDDSHLYFIYKRQDHALAQDLFAALRGDTFSTFQGMEKTFGLEMSKDNVSGSTISDFTQEEILRVSNEIKNGFPIRNVIPIVLTPFGNHDDPKVNSSYWNLKHAFLNKQLPLQVVHTKTLDNRNTFKWAIAGIGLQIFAKLGGVPWKVKPELGDCLIVGIGQSHQIKENQTVRFFAYAVLTDSNGIFEKVQILGDNSDEEDYKNSFGNNLRRIFNQYSSKYSNFVVHSTFKIKKEELNIVAEVLSEQKAQIQNGEFVSMKFNSDNRFFGFSINHNSLVPFESSLIRLSKSEYLVWFEGLQYGGRLPPKTISNPVHVKFLFPYDELSNDRKKKLLQDAINLSGANWRGFNAKSLPVSVYYAQLIAKYLKEFNRLNLEKVDVNILKPWFL